MVTGRNQLTPTEVGEMVVGDVEPLRIVLVGRNFEGGLDPASGDGTITPKLAIGDCAGPTGGSYDLTGSGAVSLQWDAIPTPSQIAGITGSLAADISVRGTAGEIYSITFSSDPGQTLGIANNALTPNSTATAEQVKDWDGTSEIWVVRLKAGPLAFSDNFSTFDETATGGDKGWEGTLSVAVIDMFIAVSESGDSRIDSTLELELSGSIGPETVTQQSVSVRCEVIVNGQTTQPFVASALYASDFVSGKTIYVDGSSAVSTDTRGNLSKYSYLFPFQTVTAAEGAAADGDTILVLPGDYSAETALGGVDGVTYQGIDGAILPAFSINTAITVKGSGLCQSINCGNSSTVIDMPDMDAVGDIVCTGGTLTAGNAGGSIVCDNGTLTAGNAGGIIYCDDGNLTAGNAGSGIYCDNGNLTAGNAGGSIYCDGGNITIRNADQSTDGVSDPPIVLSNAGSLTIENSRHESTELDGTVVSLSDNWSGSLKIFNSRLKATNADTNSATTGISYGTGVTGTVQLDGVIIETAEDGTGVAKCIDSPDTQTVRIGSDLVATHDVDANITPSGGDLMLDSNITA
ncbi:hypothetical protein [Marivita sp.]|uniref:hypothetical protein n=1 Tax=Marivita sp. TaxID=2003365 RepID=UPI0025C4D320|nr:hypothetical protein [Marivita sp.]